MKPVTILALVLSATGFIACHSDCQQERRSVNAAQAAMQENRRAGAALEQSIVEAENRIRQCEATQRDRRACTSPVVRAKYRELKALHRETEKRADKLMNDYEQALSKKVICERDPPSMSVASGAWSVVQAVACATGHCGAAISP